MQDVKIRCTPILIPNDSGILVLGDHINWNIPGQFRGTKFHLYLMSNEDIKSGDIITDTDKIYTAPDIDGFIGLYKIEGSTDVMDDTANIPQYFTDRYVESFGTIGEVDVIVKNMYSDVFDTQACSTELIIKKPMGDLNSIVINHPNGDITLQELQNDIDAAKVKGFKPDDLAFTLQTVQALVDRIVDDHYTLKGILNDFFDDANKHWQSERANDTTIEDGY